MNRILIIKVNLMTLTWHEKTYKIKDLKDYLHNPRKINKENFEKLVKSIKDYGYNNRLLVDHDGTIIAGHQRKKALKKAGFKDNDTIKVLTPNRQLTIDEFKKLNISDNGHYGDFDIDMLSIDFNPGELLDLSVPEFYFNDLKVELDENESNKKDDSKEKNKHIKQCPNCGYELEV